MYNNRRFELNEEQAAAFLENAVNKVRSDADVDSLAELNKMFKKNVPFSLRKYVTAYLLREALKHDHSFRPSRFERNNSKRNEVRENLRENNKSRNNEEPSIREERQPRPRVEIPEEQATTIFISIGRNRRVFPRDLVSLLINVGGLERERIGNIKVLANYSFVQLYTEDTEKAIASLNDYEYRGRRLAVNLSRLKETEEGGEDTNEDVESQTDEEVMSAEDAAAYAAAEKAANNEPFGNS
ncbi:MAG: DbpA RNA binding domain-containing protein [Treponema sp.]|nr:DbpA RNA binding domain-containing protein [Treponema sp.]